MIRDPRDIAVSAYYYHLWTRERWARAERERLEGHSYQEYLRGIDREEGLSAEITRLSGNVFRRMAGWDYHRPDYCELRYEDLIADERTWFERVFRHYGFRDDAVSEALTIAERLSFSNSSKRNLGEVTEGSHLRSGKPGQWREEFSERHRDLFKRLTGDLLIRLGYESDDTW